MATQKTCDRCGKSGARTVTAFVSIIGLEAEDVTTAHGEQADVCSADQPTVLAMLHAHALAQLVEQEPYLKEIRASAEARDAATTEEGVAKAERERIAIVGEATKKSDARKAALLKAIAKT